MRTPTILSFGFLFVTLIAHAQHPAPAPRGVKTFSMSMGVDQRYSLTKSVLDTAPRMTFDYRMTAPLRFSVGISRVFTESKVPNLFHNGAVIEGDHQGTTVTMGMTWKFMEWGKQK